MNEGQRFDMEYYQNMHLPMVRQKLGVVLKGIGLEQGLGGVEPGSPPIYIAMSHLYFDSVEAFQTAFGPNAESILEDVPNYTDIQPKIQISEVKI